jgi:hypothetical protein
MNYRHVFALLASLALFSVEFLTAAEPSWTAAWKAPQAEHRPLQIVHGWFAQQPEPDKEADRLKNCGLGGIVCNVHRPNYLRDEFQWTKFVRCVQAARTAGLRVWIYDEDGYPSLGAGGVVLDGHRELESLALVYDKESAEPFSIRPAYEFTHASNNYAAARRYPNPLDAAATKRFLAVTHEQYRTRLGKELFDQVEAFFTDEPSMMAVNIGQIPEDVRVNVKIDDPLDPNVKPLPMVSWVADLPERYRTKYGEDLLTQRKSLFGGDTSEDRRVRQQFWSLLGELDKERFYGQIQDWCRNAGASFPTLQKPDTPLRLASSGHTLHEENVPCHVPLDGNKLQVLARMDLPGLDELNSDPMVPFYGGWKTAAFPCSAAMLTGKRLVMTELSDFAQKMGGEKKPVDLSWMQAATAWQAAWGVTEFTLYYRIEDRSEETYRHYCDFTGRINAVLRSAVPYRPVLLYYPIEILQAEYIPTAEPFSLQQQSTAARKTVESFERLGGHLTQTQIPFTLIDGEFLAQAAVKGKELEITGSRFHTLILPDGTLPKSVTEKIDSLRKSGVRVLVDGQDSITIPNVPVLEPANARIAFGHFRRDGYDIFIMMNADKENVYAGSLKNVPGTEGFILDPQTGGALPFNSVIRLAPLQTLLYVIR